MANTPKETPEPKKASPQGIKQPVAADSKAIDLNPKAPRAAKMRTEIRLGAMALVAIVLLAIVMGILKHGAKQKQAAMGTATSDKPVLSAAGAADKLTDNLQTKAKQKAGVLGQRDQIEPAVAGEDVLGGNRSAVPAGDPAGDLNLPPTRIAQRQPGAGAGAPANGPRQPSAAELRREQQQAEELSARNSSLSKGGAAGRSGGAPSAPQSPVDALSQLAGSLSRASAGAQGQPGSGAAGAAGRQDDDQNRQDDKITYLDKNRQPQSEPTFSRVSRETAVSRFEVKAGWDIPATLEQGMNSDLPGDVRGIVRENVYDTVTGRYLLIPQGARVIGTYNSRVTYGQRGLQVVWTRLIFPDGSSIDLGGLNGQDVRGLSGFRDKVDNHYGKLFAIAALTSVFAAGVELSQRQNSNTTGFAEPTVNQTVSASVGQQIGQLGTTLAQKQLNVQPTITIPIGYRFNIRVRKDLIFDTPYAERQAIWK